MARRRSSIRDEDLAKELRLPHKNVRTVLSRLERDYIVRRCGARRGGPRRTSCLVRVPASQFATAAASGRGHGRQLGE